MRAQFIAIDISQNVTLSISGKHSSVSHQDLIDKRSSLVGMNSVGRTAIAKNQIRASRAIYRFTDRGSLPRSQRRVFRLPIRPLGRNFFSVSVLRRIESIQNKFRHTVLHSMRSCVPRHRTRMRLSNAPTALDAGRQCRDRHARY